MQFVQTPQIVKPEGITPVPVQSMPQVQLVSSPAPAEPVSASVSAPLTVEQKSENHSCSHNHACESKDLLNQEAKSKPSCQGTCKTGGGCTKKNSARLAARKKKAVNDGEVFSITINGVKYTETTIDPEMSLVEYIRSVAQLYGTKKSCGEGGCGACTVTLSYYDETINDTVDVSVNSCLRPAIACNGMEITTVEGLGSRETGYDDIQQRLADFNGTQCGFCSPGWVMNMHSLLQRNASPTQEEVEKYFDGNLCRCTGYRPILSAFKTFATSVSDSPDVKAAPVGCKGVPDIEELMKKNFPPYEPKKEDAEKKGKLMNRVKPSTVVYDGITWETPQSLTELYSLLDKYDPTTTKIVFANTSSGVYKDLNPTVYIDIQYISDLKKYTIESSGVRFGAAVVITDVIDILTGLQSTLSSTQGAFLGPLLHHLYRVASSQIRNAGSIGGNLMMAHNFYFTSDIYVAMMGLGATVKVGSSSGTTSGISMTDLYSTNMSRKALLEIYIPFSVQNQTYNCYKEALRHVFAHSLINSSCSIIVDPSTHIVSSTPILAFGGLQQKIMRMTKTESYLVGKNITSSSTLSGALSTLSGEAIPDSSFGRDAFRKNLVLAFFYKFYLSLVPNLSSQLVSATQVYDRGVSGGVQSYQTNPAEYPVSKAMPKRGAVEQTSGEAEYTEDISVPNGTLYAAFVVTEQANATISSVDASAALAMTGVVSYISAADVPGTNDGGNDVPLFATTQALYAGQPVGMIVADTQRHADEAAKYVTVQYKNIKTPILTIDEAISHKSFFPVPETLYDSPIEQGDISVGFAESDHIVEATTYVDGQYHFHLEGQTVLVVPQDDGSYQVYSATQATKTVQAVVAGALGTNYSNVEVTVKRCGGGYGGKLTNSAFVAGAVAVASHKLGAPVRAVVDLSTCMQMLGKRHPIKLQYKAGFMKDGTLKSLYMQTWIDCGCSTTDSNFEAYALLKNLDNAYNWPNFKVEARLMKTNLPTNTSCRGPGWVPAVFFSEHVLEHIATYLNNPALPAYTIKKNNFYKAGQVTPDGCTLTYWNLDSIYDQLLTQCDFNNRWQQVQTYNSSNYWTKKGLGVVPLKWGVYWMTNHHNALIAIYGDGTVSVSHSGVEIGQGIDTKVAQTVAYELGIDMSLIKIEKTSSLTSPNTTPTGGSTTSGLCSQAAIYCCNELNRRLAPVKVLRPKADWAEIISTAAGLGIDLQAAASTHPGTGAQGGAVQYNCYAAAVTQVHIDVLTGRVDIERSDLLYDCGTSMNPTVDIGQIEGGFVYGLGYYLSEQLFYDSSTGTCTTDGTWEYKPPSAMDIPIDLRVSLLKNSSNPNGVLSSKAVGEPPLGVSCSVMFALQQAISSARAQFGTTGYFDFNTPASVDQIQTTCKWTYNNFFF